jgi:hypothetical protein
VTLPESCKSAPVGTLDPFQETELHSGGHDPNPTGWDTPPRATAFEHLTQEIENGRMRNAAGEQANAATAGY